MGRSLSAKLVYGYDLGGGEDEWKIREADEYGGLPDLEWLDEDNDDIIDQAQRRLLTVVAGFTETWETKVDDDYFKREREAEARLGVEFEWYGLSDYSSNILAAHVMNIYGAQAVDPAALAVHPDRAKWDAALASAVAALGVTPTQGRPDWLLCSYYG